MTMTGKTRNKVGPLDFETEIPDITRVCEKTKLDALFDQRDHTCTKVLLKTFDLSTYFL